MIYQKTMINLFLFVFLSLNAAHASDYALDATHSFISFKVKHMGVAFVHGRFNKSSGSLKWDQKNLKNSKLHLSIDVNSIDTANKDRDQHLLGKDFFDVQKNPLVTFESSSIKAQGTSFLVKGKLTLLGISKEIDFVLNKSDEIKDMFNLNRIGIAAQFQIKRSDFGMNKMLEAIGDDVLIEVDLEATRS